jgi:hypothetical protein
MLSRIFVLIVLAALSLSSASCGKRHRVVDIVLLCDHTTSSRCDEESVRKAARPFITEPVPSSRFEVVIVGCGSDDTEIVYEIVVPERWGSGATQKKRAWIEAEERHLGSLRFKRPQRCSGIVGGIDRSVRRLRESKREKKMLLVDSDLREVSTETGFNFERSIPSPPAFVEAARQHGLLPDLRGIDVVSCDVHADSTPDARRWSAKQANALHAAWAAYFSAGGAGHVEFLERCPWEKPESAEIARGDGR